MIKVTVASPTPGVLSVPQGRAAVTAVAVVVGAAAFPATVYGASSRGRPEPRLSIMTAEKVYTAEELADFADAQAVAAYRLPEADLLANVDQHKPPQSWYDEDEDLFGL